MNWHSFHGKRSFHALDLWKLENVMNLLRNEMMVNWESQWNTRNKSVRWTRSSKSIIIFYENKDTEKFKEFFLTLKVL